MSKKRDQMKRRRQISKTRKGSERAMHKTQQKSVIQRDSGAGDKFGATDIWIAVGVVVLVVAAFVALYHFAVRRPKTAAGPTLEPTAATTSSKEATMSWIEPPPMSIDRAKTYEAVLKTEKGDVRLELYDDRAPVTVNNFVFLSRQGFYDGVTFHRVMPGFMAQTGDPTGTGSGGPGYTFGDEFNPSLRHDDEGIVSMANVGSNTNGSQFFITYGPEPHLDGQHTVFGKVIEGMEVVRALSPRDPSKDPDAPPGDRILTIEIVEK